MLRFCFIMAIVVATCFAACPEGQFQALNLCISCPQRLNCKTCAIKQGDIRPICLSCPSNFALNQKSECVPQGGGQGEGHNCPKGSVQLGSTCYRCPAYCNQCTMAQGDQTPKCTQCQEYFQLTTNFQCELSIQLCSNSNQYFNIQKLKCEKCMTGCTKCQLSVDDMKVACLACEDNFQLDPESYICEKMEDDSTKCDHQNQFYGPDRYNITRCLPCPQECEQCQFDYNVYHIACQKCRDGFNLAQNQTCVRSDGGELPPPDNNTNTTHPEGNNETQPSLNCSRGSYERPDRTCQSCQTNCEECTFQKKGNQVICHECVQGMTLSNNQCNIACTKGQYAVTTDSQLQCMNCPNNCESCTLIQITQTFICYKCKEGYILSVEDLDTQTCVLQSKQQDSKCQSNQFLVQYSFLSACLTCPISCTTCYLAVTKMDLDINKLVNCTGCSSGYTLQSGKCTLNKSKASCLNNQYIVYENDNYLCKDCPQGCNKCISQTLLNETLVLCKECSESKIQILGKCLSFPCQADNQFVIIDKSTLNPICQSCQDNCLYCKLQNISDINSYVCTQCPLGFALSPDKKICESASQAAATCDTDQFQMYNINSNKYQCRSCPKECATCKLKQATAQPPQQQPQQPPEIQCTACNKNFELIEDQGICREICQEGEFFQEESQTCKACSLGCVQCENLKVCSVCRKGMEPVQISEEVTRCKLSDIKANKCPERSFYSPRLNTCKCIPILGEFYNEALNQCMPPEDFSPCQLGQYLGSNSACLSCTAAGSETDGNHCQLCTGPLPDNCIKCEEGYFLDQNNFTCQKCTQGCESCQSTEVCDICQPGSYRVQQNSQGEKVICVSQCPAGQLPYIPSLRYLNPKFFQFTQNELQSQEDEGGYQLYSTRSIAIGRNFLPVVSATTIPVYFDEQGLAFYENELIRLDCAPCRRNCPVCDEGGIQNYHNYDCYYTPNCPLPLVKVNIQGVFYCQNATSASQLSADLDERSLIGGNLQSEARPLIIHVITNQASTVSLTYQWTVEEITFDYGAFRKSQISNMIDRDYIKFIMQNMDQMLPTLLVNNLKNQLFKDVVINSNDPLLMIPKKNLNPYLRYNLKCVIATGGQQVSLSSKFTVVYEEDIEQGGSALESLGILSEMFGAFPRQGVARETVFFLEINSFSKKFFARSWIFGVEVVPEIWKSRANPDWSFTKIFPSSSGGVIMKLPYIPIQNTSLNEEVQRVIVRFFARSNGVTFSTLRVVHLTSRQFNISEDNTLNKLTNGQSASLPELSESTKNVVGLFKSQQKRAEVANSINTTESSDATAKCPPDDRCSGNGTCVLKAESVDQYYCKCNSGFTGKNCDFTLEQMKNWRDIMKKYLSAMLSQTITNAQIQNNIQELLSLLKDLTSIDSQDLGTVQTLADMLDTISSYINDQITAQDFIQALANLLKLLSEDQLFQQKQSDIVMPSLINLQKQVQATMNKMIKQLTTKLQLSQLNSKLTINTDSINLAVNFVEGNAINKTKIKALVLTLDSPNANSQEANTFEFPTEALPNKAFISKIVLQTRNTFKQGAQLASDLLSLDLSDPVDGSKISIKDLQKPINITFSKFNSKKSQCVFFNETIGQFSNLGCVTVTINNTQVQCQCNHLTQFGLVNQQESQIVDDRQSNGIDLQILSTHGRALSWIAVGTVFLLLLVLF